MYEGIVLDRIIDRSIVGLFLTSMALIAGWVLTTALRSWRQRQALRMYYEFRTRLIEKMGSGKDFVEFAQSEGGRQFLQGSLPLSGTREEAPPPQAPLGRILGSVQRGILLGLLGLGLIYLGLRYDIYPNPFHILGVVGLSLGLGFLISAGASWQLSRKLGLLADSPAEGHTRFEGDQP